MKKFIINLTLFVFSLSGLIYSLDLYISYNLKKSNSFAVGEYSTWNDVLEGKVNSDIVIYGSSRAWQHINPIMITNEFNLSTYNLGINGHNFWLQHLRHSLLLQNNIQPKLIIHALDMTTLVKRKDLHNLEQFLPYMLWNNEINKAIRSYNGFDLVDYTIPLTRYSKVSGGIKESLKMTKVSADKTWRIKGYRGEDIQWNSDFDKAKKKMKNYEIKLDNPSIVLFDEYLRECKSKNIYVILVYTPEYIEGQKFYKNKDKIISLYKSFGKKYNIPFYDYSNDEISYNKKNFYNAMHLNKLGSELFTQKLIDTLKNSKILKSIH
ncbi:hypothetical protein [Flavobacterium sp.]|uniref:hypothetical protein n=1 Tax=Flavobacterium sp. TaxID=239 RepID=UPI00374D8635